MQLKRTQVSTAYEIIEKQNWTMKLVGFLIKVGIIPIYIDKNGQFTFKLFSWKTIVYLLLSLGHVFLFFFFLTIIYNISFSTVLGVGLSNNDLDNIISKVSYVMFLVEIVLPLLLFHGISKYNGYDIKVMKLASGRIKILAGEVILSLDHPFGRKHPIMIHCVNLLAWPFLGSIYDNKIKLSSPICVRTENLMEGFELSKHKNY